MFTPQKKAWSGWSLSPRTEKTGQKNGSGSESGRILNGAEKGKEVTTFLEATTPQNGETMDLADRLSTLENEVRIITHTLFLFLCYLNFRLLLFTVICFLFDF